MKRSAEFWRGADWQWVHGATRAHIAEELAAAEAREAFPIPDTLPAVPGAREAGERDYLGESRQAAIARAESAESLVAGLRGALELLLKCNALGVAIPWGRAVAALAITPASAANWIKAEAYREAARLVDSCSAETLHREADRMEKEGANGR